MHDQCWNVCQCHSFHVHILQEAFEEKRAEFISRSQERQKRLQLAAEERQQDIQHELERNKLFLQDKRPQKANVQAHPYSGK